MFQPIFYPPLNTEYRMLVIKISHRCHFFGRFPADDIPEKVNQETAMYTNDKRIKRFLAISALYFRLTEKSAAMVISDMEFEKILNALHYYAPQMPSDTLTAINT